ncbi:hypothetical protein ACJJTC_004406 [Scirpophaga incertulas]
MEQGVKVALVAVSLDYLVGMKLTDLISCGQKLYLQPPNRHDKYDLSVDYDYAYDYSEMTIKPQNGTTPKPLNVSSTLSDIMAANGTLRSTVYEETITESIRNTTSQLIDTTMITEKPIVLETTTTKPVIEEVSTKVSELLDANSTSSVISTGCKKGFILNQKGTCEFKLQSASNAWQTPVSVTAWHYVQLYSLAQAPRGSRCRSPRAVPPAPATPAKHARVPRSFAFAHPFEIVLSSVLDN